MGASTQQKPSTSVTVMADRLDWQGNSQYGWKSFRPQCLQFLNNPKIFTGFLCAFIMTQGMMINGITSLVISTIEKRFEFSSTEAGMITSTNEISVAIVGVYISYFMANGHKPKWLGLAAVLIGVGGFAFSFPHYIAGKYQVAVAATQDATSGNSSLGICTIEREEESCSSEETSNVHFFMIFVLAQVLIGAGAAPVFTLGTAFIEETLPPSSSPMYLACMYSIAALAPAIGFFVGGAFLNYQVDIGEETVLTQQDPRWVGAWWLGFLVCGCMSLMCSIPLFGYPKYLPCSLTVTEKVPQQKPVLNTSGYILDRLEAESGVRKTPKWLLNLKLMPSAIRSLMTNLTFLFDVMAMALEKLLVFGLGVFFPKLIESQFGITASVSSIYTGLAVVPGIAGGTLVGGIISSKLKSDPARNAKFSFIVTIITMGACASLVIGCPDKRFAGVTEPYTGYIGSATSFKNLTASCNVNCSCADSTYIPTCGSDGVAYFSPCHAGCSVSGNDKSYSNCSCIVGDDGSLGTAMEGPCESTCNNLVPFLFCLFVVLFLTFLPDMPAVTVLLKSVENKEKSLALGLQWLVIGVMGRIPGPVVFGRLIDNACLLWQEECGQRGSCVQYSNYHLSYLTLTSALVIKGFSATFFFLSWFCYKPKDSSRRKEVLEENEFTEYLTVL